MGLVRFFRAVILVMRVGEDAVVRDGLTGLYRREEALRLGSKAIRRSLKKGSRTSVIMIDLDDLKEVNDSKGHDEGDILLKKMGSLIIGACRKKIGERETDISGGYGGDEFIIILPGSSEDGAEAFIGRLKEGSTSAGLEFSYGIASVRPGVNFGAAISMADEAMYRDKRLRKNGGDL